MRRLLSVLLALLLFCSVLPAAYADGYTGIDETTSDQNGESIETRAEQTEWFYRIINGVVEKRLWSYTYGKWLTDWIPTNV